MSRSATPATRNEATTRLKPPKMTTSAELPIGTAIRGSRGRLRTVANGCGRLRTVADGCGRGRNVERTHPQPPDPQSETGTLATHSGKKHKTHWHEAVSSALNFPFLKDVSQNCFVFDVVNLKNEEVSQTCFVFDVVKFKN